MLDYLLDSKEYYVEIYRVFGCNFYFTLLPSWWFMALNYAI